MTRPQKQRLLIVLVLALAGLVFLRHLARRGGVSKSADGSRDVEALAVAAPQLPQGGRTELLRSVRAHLEEGVAIAAEDGSRAGTRVAVLSLTRAGQAAAVSRGQGPTLRDALAAAAGALARGAGKPEIADGRLKVDLLSSRGEEERFDEDGEARLDRSLEGLWLAEPDLILLPEELLSRRLVSTKGDLHYRRLREYLAETGRKALAPKEDPGRAGAPYYRVGFDSFMEGDGGLPVQLYRGNDRSPELTPPALLATARLGGDYLLRHQKEDGSFGYSYEPKKDSYNDDYNLLRHAGTCYALVELFQAAGDPRYLEASRRGLENLLAHHARPPKDEDAAAAFEAIVSPGEEAKLGGAALTVLALVEYQRAGGDDRWAPRATKLARFLLHQQEESGHFHSKYFYGEPDPEPFDSIYYPGEAILALARLHGLDPRPEWLAAARRGADWLIDVRDAAKSTEDLPHDHWLLMALDELHAATGESRYADHAARIAAAIVAAQRTSSPQLDWIGSFYDPPRSTPTATRGEALVAMHRLAVRRGEDPRVYLEALLRMAAFQRRCQLTLENSLYLPRPDLALGGFRRSLTHWEVRIDYVQHNLSALLGLRSILLQGV